MSDEDALTLGDHRVAIVVSDPPWYQNTYVVTHRPTGDAVVVDPGAPRDRILEAVRAGNANIRAILLTHAHPDHITSAAALEAALNVDTHLHQGETAVMEQAPRLAATFTGESLPLPGRPVPFGDGAVLAFGGLSCTARPTPGHTPGGVCLVFPDFVLTGDTLFNHGVGRTDLPGGDPAALGRSIDGLLADLDHGTLLFSGHGPAWTVGEAHRWWGSG